MIDMKNVKQAVNMRLLWAVLPALVSFQAFAADNSREVIETGDTRDAFVEIRLLLSSDRIPLIGFNDQDTVEESTDSINGVALLIDTRFRYKNVFLEAVSDSFSNITLGYSLTGPGRGNIDLIASNLFFDVERSQVPGFESITDRDADINLGVRSSISSDNNIAQFELTTDVSNSHSGVVGSIQVGRQQQIRNWNLHALAGFRYFSDNVIDHYFGVPSNEATATVQEYKGEAGLMSSLLVGATLPLSEKWLFNVQAEYIFLPDSVAESPLAQGDVAHSVGIGIGYVFGGT